MYTTVDYITNKIDKANAEPERVRAAMELGMGDIPVVLFYHNMNRQSCSAPTNCFEQINNAMACSGVNSLPSKFTRIR